jgi:hypothetical protein
MPEEWIVRVQDREYGPVDFETLQEWKNEGRVLPANEVRQADVDLWTAADKIPGLFPPPLSTSSDESVGQRQSLSEILAKTLRVYRKGFLQFLGLTAIVVVPSICAQLSSTALASPNTEMDFQTLLAAMFNLGMLLLSLAAWPVYIAGIQILTSELSVDRPIAMFDLFQRALSFWPRVALICFLVYGVFFLLLVLALGILLMVLVGASSFLTILFALTLLVLQIWMFGRWFINVLFWQQFAVLAQSDIPGVLRRSKELARSGRNLPWFQRPSWRGAFLASLWFGFVLVLSIGPEWSMMQSYFHEAMTTQDPQALLQSLSANSKPVGLDLLRLVIGFLQALLHPLLGIAFVLLYFDSLGGDAPRP